MFIKRGGGVGERSCPLMAINWPFNGWLKKMGRIYGRSGKRRVLQQTTAEMNSVPCEISQVPKTATSSTLQHLQKMKTNQM